MWLLNDGEYDSAFIQAKATPSMVENLLKHNEGMTYASDSAGARVYFDEHSGSWKVFG